MSNSIVNISAPDALALACKTLSSGGLVVFPTETTYGIGADATNQAAVDKLLEYKARREGKPLSIAVCDQAMAEQYVELNGSAKKIYTTFLPGPVTVVSTGKHILAKGVESESGTVGVRIPKYDFVLQLVKAYGKPITATGANASYKKRPYSIDDIFSVISDKQKNLIDLVIDAGELLHNEPSTVIDTTLDDVTVLRQGSIAFSEKNTFTTHSETETQKLGAQLIKKYKNLLSSRAIIIALEGEMGAGKTQFSKGIAQGLGVKQTVVSPTYTLSREYSFEGEGVQLKLIHIDTWRLFEQQEFLDLGFAEMVEGRHVIVVEWADRVSAALKQFEDEAKLIWVKIDLGEKENDRTISISDSPHIAKG